MRSSMRKGAKAMESPTSLTKPEMITADASTVINLNATGCPREIIGTLQSRVVVVDVVQAELETGRCTGLKTLIR